MPESLLRALQFLVVVLLYLFFARVLRAVWTELHPPKLVLPAAAPPAPAPAAATPSARSAAPAQAQPAPAPPQRPGRRVRVTDPGALRGSTWEISAESKVGRAPTCEILLNEPTVSSVHAKLIRRDGQLVVEDLDSRNGTFVNDQRVSGSRPVFAGDRVGIGPVVKLDVEAQ